MADQVKVTASDTTADYLSPKIVAGPHITTEVLNPGGNEQLKISGQGGVMELINLWGNTNIALTPENTNPGKNFKWKIPQSVQPNLSVLASGWRLETTEIEIPIDPDNKLFVPRPDKSHWFIQLKNNQNVDRQGFYTGVNLPKNTQTLRGGIRARYNDSFSTDPNPDIAIFVAGITEQGQGNFVLAVVSPLTSQFQDFTFDNFDLSIFTPVVVYGWGVIMKRSSSHEVQVASFWCEFI